MGRCRCASDALALVATAVLVGGCVAVPAPLSEAEWAQTAGADAGEARGGWAPAADDAGRTATRAEPSEEGPELLLPELPEPVDFFTDIALPEGDDADDRETWSQDAEDAEDTSSEAAGPSTAPECSGKLKEDWDDPVAWDLTEHAVAGDGVLVLNVIDSPQTAAVAAGPWQGGLSLRVDVHTPEDLPVDGTLRVTVERLGLDEHSGVGFAMVRDDAADTVAFVPWIDGSEPLPREEAIRAPTGLKGLVVRLEGTEEELELSVKKGKDTFGEVTLGVDASGVFDLLRVMAHGAGTTVEVKRTDLETCDGADELCDEEDCEDDCGGICNPLVGCVGCDP